MPFDSLPAFRALMADLPAPDAAAAAAAAARNGQLTKPPGALGRLEALVIRLAGLQGRAVPVMAHPQIVVFAGNHGVAGRGVSAFPAEVTAQMVANFRSGGAAINQLARAFGARLDVRALELERPTADFTQGPAMTEAELADALRVGWEAVAVETDVLVAGEMGIGNTTAAAALATAIFGGTGWAGRGTGVDDEGLARKEAAVAAGLAANPGVRGLEALRCLGGREIAAMAGAMACARVRRVPLILDGFIACAAAAALADAFPGALDHAVAGHVGAEGAHGRLLAHLGLEPLLSLGLRLGEGSGAALALGVVRGALACHAGMATFAEAGVAGKG